VIDCNSQAKLHCNGDTPRNGRQFGSNIKSAVYGNLGNLYQHMGQTEKALYSQIKCRNAAKDAGDENAECIALGSLSDCYADLGRYKEALAIGLLQVELAQKNEDMVNLALALNSLGGIYMSQNMLAEGILVCYRSMALHIKTGDVAAQAMTMNNICTLLQTTSSAKHDHKPSPLYTTCPSLKEASELASKVLHLAVEHNAVERTVGTDFLKYRLQALTSLSNIRLLQGQTELALQHLRDYLDLTLSSADDMFCGCGCEAKTNASSAWRVGERVQIDGLIKASQFNGIMATVKKVLDQSDRLLVVMEGGKEISVKCDNLKPEIPVAPDSKAPLGDTHNEAVRFALAEWRFKNICSNCLVVRFCSEACMTKEQSTHKSGCAECWLFKIWRVWRERHESEEAGEMLKEKLFTFLIRRAYRS